MGWRTYIEGGNLGEYEDMERELNHVFEEGKREGCREGYEKAMMEMRRRGSYGERNYYDGRMYDGMDGDNYGERRGVKNTGPYAGEYRRRHY